MCKENLVPLWVEQPPTSVSQSSVLIPTLRNRCHALLFSLRRNLSSLLQCTRGTSHNLSHNLNSIRCVSTFSRCLFTPWVPSPTARVWPSIAWPVRTWTLMAYCWLSRVAQVVDTLFAIFRGLGEIGENHTYVWEHVSRFCSVLFSPVLPVRFSFPFCFSVFLSSSAHNVHIRSLNYG